ncbi:hypothetical protein PSEUDO9AG_40562 [Pseudomonas sp. 9Ag]|nr:hypothetical protein PSEUDO9AG_40562 [Pseudomonas sp. 9Ag]
MFSDLLVTKYLDLADKFGQRARHHFPTQPLVPSGNRRFADAATPTKFLRRRNTAPEHFTQSLDKLARMLRRLSLQYALGAVNGEGLPNLQSP